MHPTGTVQTFTAPVDGIYQFELWGAQSGGYTKVAINLTAKESIYVIVGGWADMTYGLGYNGGGAYLSYCVSRPADGSGGAHNDGSGGGMTHISRTENVAMASPSIYGKGSWNPDGTIAIAGGGGGGGWYGGNIAEGTWLNTSCCGKGVTGGTGYINTDKVNNGYTNMTLVFNRPGYETKPCNRHYGYARVSLLKRN